MRPSMQGCIFTLSGIQYGDKRWMPDKETLALKAGGNDGKGG